MSKTVKITQDTNVLFALLKEAISSDKGFNFIYLDNRSIGADIDSQDDIGDVNLMPAILPQELGKIPDSFKSRLEALMIDCPQPRLDYMIKALFEIAYHNHGTTNEESGKFLGVNGRKMHRWVQKLGIKSKE